MGFIEIIIVIVACVATLVAIAVANDPGYQNNMNIISENAAANYDEQMHRHQHNAMAQYNPLMPEI